MTMTVFALILFCIMTEAAHELCFKKAAGGDFRRQLRDPFIWLGISFWGVEVVAWIKVLESVPLAIAYPLMSLVYVATVLGGALILKEKISFRHTIGALLITTGVACIGVTGQ